MARQTKSSGNGYQQLRDDLRTHGVRRLYLLCGEETFLIERALAGLRERCLIAGAEAIDSVRWRGTLAARLSLDELRDAVKTPPFMSPRRLVLVWRSSWFSGGKSGVGTSGNENADGQVADPSERMKEDSTSVAEDVQASAAGGGKASVTRDGKVAMARDVKASAARRSMVEERIELLGDLPDSVCLVFVEDKIDRRQKSLIATVERHGMIAEINRQTADDLVDWIIASCRKQGMSCGKCQATALAERCEYDMQMIWQELNKLFLALAYSGEKTITDAWIENLAPPDLRGSVFDLTDALAAGQADRALLLADRLISLRQPVPLLLFMLNRQVRQLILAAEVEDPSHLAAMLKLPPFIAGRLRRQTSGMSMQTLENLQELCWQTDLAIKSGQLSERIALDVLIAQAAEQFTAGKRERSRAGSNASVHAKSPEIRRASR